MPVGCELMGRGSSSTVRENRVFLWPSADLQISQANVLPTPVE